MVNVVALQMETSHHNFCLGLINCLQKAKKLSNMSIVEISIQRLRRLQAISILLAITQRVSLVSVSITKLLLINPL